MTPSELRDEAARQLGPQYPCSLTENGAVRIATPLLYPDNDVIDVFVCIEDGEFIATDYGEAMARLQMHFWDDRPSPNQEQHLAGIAPVDRLEFDGGPISYRCASLGEIGSAIMFVAQAAARVADLRWIDGHPADGTASSDVQRWFRHREIAFTSGVRVAGRSGHEYTVDFDVAVPPLHSLVFHLRTSDPDSAPRIAEHAYIGCRDIRDALPEPARCQLVSLFHCDSAPWTDEDFNRLATVSRVARWTDRDEFERILRAPRSSSP